MKKLSEVLSSAVEQKELLRAARAQTVAKRWDEAVGGLLAQKTVPDWYDHGVLWICAKGASWAQELRLHEDQILERLNTMAGEPLFRELRVSLRPRLREYLS